MRYAIFSDIHANRQAWAAVLKDLRNHGAEVLVCLGDVVGYGPMPLEVLHSIRAEASNFVIGNHDAAAVGLLDSSCFNDEARRVIEWTGRQLDQESIEFIEKIPLTLENDSLCFVHAERVDPWRFGYVEDCGDASANLAAVSHRLTFLGHTHFPTAFIETDGTVQQFPDRDFSLAPGQRALVNVGSVGEPRNPDDFRARYVLFDSESDSVFFRSVDFDIEAYRADLAVSGLDIEPYFLRAHDRKAVETVLDQLHDFAPVTQPAPVPVPVRQVQRLRVPVNQPPRSRKFTTIVVPPPPTPIASRPPPHRKKSVNKTVKQPLPTKEPERPEKTWASRFVVVAIVVLVGGLGAGAWYFGKIKPETTTQVKPPPKNELPPKSPWLKPPRGGVSLLMEPGRKNWRRIQGVNPNAWKMIQIVDMPFTRAVSINVPKADPRKRSRYQFMLQTDRGIKKGDVVWVTFFIRGEGLVKDSKGKAKARAHFQKSRNKYDKILSISVEAGNEWRQYAEAVEMKKDFKPNQTNFVVHLAFGKQRIDIGGVQILNFRDKLTVVDLPKRR